MLTKKQLQDHGFEFIQLGDTISCRLLNPKDMNEKLFIRRAKTMQTLRLSATLFALSNNMLKSTPI